MSSWLGAVCGARPPPGARDGYATWLRRWREAQARSADRLQAIGDTLLGQPEIRADPRYGQLRTALATLPGLMPRFDGRLEAVLGRLGGADDPAVVAVLRGEWAGAVEAYRRHLAEASTLAGFEDALLAHGAGDMPPRRILDDELVAMARAMAALPQEQADV